MKTNIAVFFGCRSVEHEVSIISAVQAMQAINRQKYDVTPVYVAKNGSMYTGDNLFTIENYKNLSSLIDSCEKVTLMREDDIVVLKPTKSSFLKKPKTIRVDLAFPIVHGTNCEDGTIAGYFEFLGLPYISCDTLSAAVGMDKAIFKDVLKSAGLPMLDCIKFRAREYARNKKQITDRILKEIGLPIIVKPVNLGSSVGISKVSTEEALENSINDAFSFADEVLVEKAITSLREINCSVIGDADDCEASVCEEPFMNDEILSYHDKYMSNGDKTSASKGMASLSRKIPADLSEEKSEEIRKLATDVFKALGCSGVVRIDFMIDTETDTVYANEINTIPGSLAFYLWDATGLKYTDMIDRLVEIAFKRQRNRENLSFTIDTNILEGATFGSKGSKGSKF